MNCPNCGSTPTGAIGNNRTYACGSIGDNTTSLCVTLKSDLQRIVYKHQIPDGMLVVAKLRNELAESRAVIERLQADNRRITEWFRRLEDAGDAIDDRIGCGCGGDRGLCSKCSQASENWGNTKETSHE